MDRLLLALDVGPLGALWRTGCGFLFLPALARLWPAAGPGRGLFALLALLFCIKAAAAVARRVAPASAAVRAAWEWRRGLARHRDSYQWRKLAWFGLGICAASAAGLGRFGWGWALGGACLGSGLLAEVAWRRLGLGVNPPAPKPT